METKKPILNFLLNHAELDPVSFHMPGHKGSGLYKRFGYQNFLEHIMDCDITEILGADNLFQTEGIIKNVQDKYASLYNANKSYLLVNGTSGGIIASILASVQKGKKIIMARNCHKSVFNALTLADIQPIYAYPELNIKYGISGPIPPSEIEELLKKNPEADAVILPSPNYYGICSDIETISEIVHRYNKVLIVDQAHGAHLMMFHKFSSSELPKSAEESGADITINSIHKTLASFTQSAILNINSDRVSQYAIEDKLQCIESTSPSYLLMASLDINSAILMEYGETLMAEWFENLNAFYKEAKKIRGLEFIDQEPGMDWTKINFSMGSLGISGEELETILTEKYGIFIELYTGNLVMCMTGIGNTKADYETLLFALKVISEQHKNLDRDHITKVETPAVVPAVAFKKVPIFDIPKIKKSVPILEAEGLICTSSIIPYPPGIPLVCPGEKLDMDILVYIKALRERGEKVIGVNGLGEIMVGAV
jgi:arginine/lysine/ornithine decarboxylase